jgi:two-component system, cell cycle response regulator CtrA
MKILLIDDDINILKKIQESFEDSNLNIECYTADSCERGLDIFKLHDFDSIIVDMRFPKMDGLTFIKTIRQSKITKPIIVISGTTAIEDKVLALDLGADDYILKPFEVKELIARVKRHIFRNNNHCSNNFVTGPLSLDIETQAVCITDTIGELYVIKLTKKEYQLLEILIFKKGITVSKTSLLKQLYGSCNTEPDAKIIDVLICKIRKKFKTYIDEELIITFWGRGYTIKDEKKFINNNVNDTFIHRAQISRRL